MSNEILTDLPTKIRKDGIKKVYDYKAMEGLIIDILYKKDVYKVKIIKYIQGRSPRFEIEYNGNRQSILCGDFILKKRFSNIFKKSLWVTHRDLCERYSIQKEVAEKYTHGSNKYISVICPYCNHKKEVLVCNLSRNETIGCPCEDKTSYSEGFVYGVLSQLDIKFKCQLAKRDFEWCNDKRYDFYIEEDNTIIETHGMQHYKWTGFTRTLEEEQENDKLKYELALKNGIKEDNYIVLDCRYSDKNWIKNNMLNDSKLKKYNLDKLTEQDWQEAHEFAINSNIIKEVCGRWNDKPKDMTMKDFINSFGKSESAIRGWLKKGAELGWCNYTPWKGNVVAVFKDGEPYIPKGREDNIFKSAREIARLSEEYIDMFGETLESNSISRVCRGERKHYKTFVFRYINDE